jgi:hypothetical protein
MSEAFGDEREKPFDLQWDGRACIVKQLGSKAAMEVARRIMNIVGGALKEAGKAGDGSHEDIVAAGAVLERIDDATLQFLTSVFCKVTSIETDAGSQIWMKPNEIPDLVFGGGPGLKRWMRWLRFCIEMSCGDFFAELRAAQKAATRTQKAATRTQTASASPSPST